MRRRRKELIIAAGLWGLLLVSAVYVSVLLFPSQISAAGLGIVNRTCQEGQNIIKRISQEMFPAVSYILTGEIEKEKGIIPNADPSYQQYLKNEHNKGEETAETEKKKEPESSAEVFQETEAVEAAVQPLNRLERFRNMAQKGSWNFDEILEFDTLLNQLYVVSAGTSVTENELDPKTLLSYDLSIAPQEGYQILIYHTHSQEAYADSAPGDVSQTVVGMGELLKECLEEYGYSVLHHKGIYDMTDGQLDRDPAYTKALPVLSSIIEAHPEIQVIIDLHRDGVREDIHLVQDINGKPTARVMYFNGMCRNETGERTDIKNPYREENMAMSLQLALTTMTDYPGMTRCIYVKSSRYNLHLRGKSALIEVGAQTNTVEEVRNAIPVIADVLNKVLTN